MNTLPDLFGDGAVSFEELGRENGFKHWYASDLADALGYQSAAGLHKALNKAIGVLLALGIPVAENIEQVGSAADGKSVGDHKLSRFGCYLVAMNADPKKEGVARAQAYFAGLADAFQQYMDQSGQIERVQIRDELSTQEKSLSGSAHRAGVQNYAFFQNAGYRGLYNMDLSRLKARKGVPDQKRFLDFMGKEELAANLFRITQTEAKIERERVRGQRPLERAAEDVGKRVRMTILDMGGTPPEQLPLADDIKEVKKTLKRTHRDFKKLDKPAKPSRDKQ